MVRRLLRSHQGVSCADKARQAVIIKLTKYIFILEHTEREKGNSIPDLRTYERINLRYNWRPIRYDQTNQIGEV